MVNCGLWGIYGIVFLTLSLDPIISFFVSKTMYSGWRIEIGHHQSNSATDKGHRPAQSLCKSWNDGPKGAMYSSNINSSSVCVSVCQILLWPILVYFQPLYIFLNILVLGPLRSICPYNIQFLLKIEGILWKIKIFFLLY